MTPQIVAAWIPCWQMLPPVQTDVAVLIVLNGGEFKNDIGRYYGPEDSEGWRAQFWETNRVVAWSPLPKIETAMVKP